ncbi:MAG: hypothetical protein GF330_02125 [Candidatus Eisenbacteria bacterium]|nr:hypothetical protein [Candidatus Eisenbacteria bacterium]
MGDRCGWAMLLRMRRAEIQRGVGLALLFLLLAAAVFAGARLLRYVHGYAGSRFRPESLAEAAPTCFYLDWRTRWSDGEELRRALGEDGVVRSIRDRTRDGGVRHNPLRVIQIALALHDLQLESPTPDRERIFRRQLDWITGDGMLRLPGGHLVWPHYDAFERYGLSGVWISALTQGQAISLLVRAARYTGEARYLELAHQAAAALRDREFGMRWEGPHGSCFYEEFPCDPPAHALNGCLLAWLGLWDLARASSSEAAREACLRDLDCFEPIVRQHARGDWTRYDLHQQRPTSPAYHELHAALAEALAAITGQPRWEARARDWRRSAEDAFARLRVAARVVRGKIETLLRPQSARPRGRTLGAGWRAEAPRGGVR